MRLVIAFAATALLALPCVAEPAVKPSMPVIRASVQDGEVLVRLDQGVLGSLHSQKPRTVVVVSQDASGKTIGEATAPVSRRMTYARVALSPALAGGSSFLVSVR